MSTLWGLVVRLVGSVLRRSSETRDDFTAVSGVQEQIIEGLRTENRELNSRCDLLQTQYDKILDEIARLKHALLKCELQHERDQQDKQRSDARIAELEDRVAQLET